MPRRSVRPILRANARRMRRAMTEAGLNWIVVRFWNDDVLGDIHNVCRHIMIRAGADRVWPEEVFA